MVSDSSGRAPVEPPGAASAESFELVSVSGLWPLLDALDRAQRKGYMPDAMADEWEAFQVQVRGPEPRFTDEEIEQSEIEFLRSLLSWCYSKLHYRSFDDMDDALMLDRIKLELTGGGE